MSGTALVERLRYEQAAGLSTVPPRHGVALVAGLNTGFALLLSLMLFTATLIAEPIISRVEAENGGPLSWSAWHSHPTVTAELCQADSCVLGDLLYFAPAVTFLGTVFLLFGMFVAAFTRSPWRARLGVCGFFTAILLAIPHVYFAEVIQTVSNVLE